MEKTGDRIPRWYYLPPLAAMVVSACLFAFAYHVWYDSPRDLIPLWSFFVFGFGIKLVLLYSNAALRYGWMRYGMGIPPATTKLLFSSRDYDIDLLEDKYGSMSIKMTDAIFRKSLHAACLMWSLLVWSKVCTDTRVACMYTLCYQFTEMGLCLAFLTQDHILAQGFFGGWTRVRDGYLRRWNVVYVVIFSGLGKAAGFVATIWLFHTQSTEQYRWTVMTLVWLPVLYGDAMAEVVGTPFGKHTFEVKGMGEINRKSIEGCVACLVFSIVPMFVILYQAGLGHAWYVMCIVMATLSTFLETVSPRSSDNFTMVLGNILVFCLFAKSLEM